MIIVYYDPFDMESRVYRMNGESVVDSYVRSDIATVSETIATDCHTYGITDVKIHAPKHIFDEIAGTVSSYETSTYGVNQIIMENV